MWRASCHGISAFRTLETVQATTAISDIILRILAAGVLPARTHSSGFGRAFFLTSVLRSGAPHGIGRSNQGKLASLPEFLANFSRRDCEPLHTSRFGDH